MCFVHVAHYNHTPSYLIQALERKADRHVTRQDDLLLRAVLRIWRAHERGKQLERYRASKLLKQKWTVWQLHIRDLRYQESQFLIQRVFRGFRR